jgi:hypothetical protein
MAISNETSESEREDLLSSTIKLLPLYGIYVFLSGWASLDSYYKFFGMDPKSLDIGLYDTLLRGFTLLFPVQHSSCSCGWLFRGPGVLWFIYGVVILGPIVTKHWSRRLLAWGLKADIAWIAALIVSLFVVFFISFQAGEDRARIDTSEQTTLPTIIFQVRNLDLPARTENTAGQKNVKNPEPTYHGKLLLFRNGTYFIHGVTSIPKTSAGNLQLSVYRAEDLKDVSVVEHQ